MFQSWLHHVIFSKLKRKISWKCGLHRSNKSFTTTDTQICWLVKCCLQLNRCNPERVYVCERDGVWWRDGLKGETHTELRVMADKGRGVWSQLSVSEKTKLFDAIGYVEQTPVSLEKPKQYIGKFWFCFCLKTTDLSSYHASFCQVFIKGFRELITVVRQTVFCFY